MISENIQINRNKATAVVLTVVTFISSVGALASHGNFLEIEIFRLYLKSSESEIPGWGPAVCFGAPRNYDACSSVRPTEQHHNTYVKLKYFTHQNLTYKKINVMQSMYSEIYTKHNRNIYNSKREKKIVLFMLLIPCNSPLSHYFKLNI